jgi:hypothetical protein
VTQFDHTAEFITAAVLRIGQYELCVVLRGHESSLRMSRNSVCETRHKMPDWWTSGILCCSAACCASHNCWYERKIRAFRGCGAQILYRSICNIDFNCLSLGRFFG